MLWTVGATFLTSRINEKVDFTFVAIYQSYI